MRTFGNIVFLLQVVFFLALVTALVLWDSNMLLAICILFTINLPFLLNTPIIRIGNGRISIFTLNPFRKNINLALADIQKITVDAGYTTRFTFDTKNGDMLSTLTSRYNDMKPLYMELEKTGVTIETQGMESVIG